MKTQFYGIGVGPGDPELLTLKAVRTIEKVDIIAVPGVRPEETVAYKIAAGAVNLENKKCLGIAMPMTKDQDVVKKSHQEAKKILVSYLAKGFTIGFLTLGDPLIYSTFSYLKNLIAQEGYKTGIVNGIPSFLACANRLDMTLTEGDEMLHIIPATYELAEGMKLSGTKVLMKCGRLLQEIKNEGMLDESYSMGLVECCGMPEEKVYHKAEEFPDQGSYFSLAIVKNRKRGE